MQILETRSGARWCELALTGALPTLILTGALLLADSERGEQLAYASVASLTVLVAVIAAVALRRRRSRQLARLLEATRRLGRADFSQVPAPLLGDSGAEGLGPVAHAYLYAAASLQRQFARMQSTLEMDRWLLSVGNADDMLRGALPLVTEILQSRCVSVVLLDELVPGQARSYDHMVGMRATASEPRVVSVDAERLREAHEGSPGLDMSSVGVDGEEFLAPLTASGAQAFRVCPLEFDDAVRGFLCIGFRVEAHDHADAGIGASDIAERLSLSLARKSPAQRHAGAAAGHATAPRQRSPLESGMHRALQREEFALVYQPIINAHSRHVSAVEALVRWPNGTDGTSRATSEFLPVAEESGLIVDLGDWVLRTACTQFEAWRGSGLELDYVSVNVSARQLRHSGLLATVLACLKRSNMEPRQLQLEITESMLQEGPGAFALLDELARRGVRLALDDFGDGNSTLSALRDLPVSALKIDRSCVAGLLDSDQVSGMVRAVIGMGAATGKLVIAEGVETEAQLKFLEAAGCDAMQGYLFARPMPAEDIPAFIGAVPEVRSLVA